MFALLLSYFRLMPEYVDFLLPFGFRHYAEDFYSCGFRQRSSLAGCRTDQPSHPPRIENFQLCYSLKSVEPSDTDEWSIRNCAIHHAFHLTKIDTTWVIVKGNDLMKQRIQSLTGDHDASSAIKYNSVDQAFETCLMTHLVFFDWSAENWRWYINWLEERFQNMTRNAFAAPMTDSNHRQMRPLHQNTAPKIWVNPENGFVQPLPPHDDDEMEDDKSDEERNNNIADDETRDFSFGKLRQVHAIAGKTDEAVLVLKQNILVLSQMKDYYNTISKRESFPAETANICQDAVDDFAFRVEGLQNDMRVQILRLETLLRWIDDRKTLVIQVFPVHSTQLGRLIKALAS